jgi:alkylated DNA repair dioxygenase AlkB
MPIFPLLISSGRLQPSAPVCIPAEWQRLQPVLSSAEADDLLECLLSRTDWTADHYEAFGRQFSIPRLQAWYADAGLRYRYSDNLIKTRPWPDYLLDVRKRVEQACGCFFNSVLLTCYRHGEDSVSWHADDERELGPNPVIASLSLGAARTFYVRPKPESAQSLQSGLQPFSLCLQHNDLLLMKAGCQRHWQHAILPEAGLTAVRINLTFRQVVIPPESGREPEPAPDAAADAGCGCESAGDS